MRLGCVDLRRSLRPSAQNVPTRRRFRCSDLPGRLSAVRTTIEWKRARMSCPHRVLQPVRRHVVAALVAFCASAAVAAQTKLPDAFLEVAVRQREDGALSRGLHRLELSCFGGQCVLTTITLNQGLDVGGGKRAFYPKIQRSTTLGGSFSVRNEGRRFIVRESGSDFGG